MLKRIDRLHIVSIHAGFHNAIDIGKAAAIVQEGIDGDLVGGIEHARHGATRLAGTLGQRQTAEGIHVGSIKRELPQLAKRGAGVSQRSGYENANWMGIRMSEAPRCAITEPSANSTIE